MKGFDGVKFVKIEEIAADFAERYPRDATPAIPSRCCGAGRCRSAWVIPA